MTAIIGCAHEAASLTRAPASSGTTTALDARTAQLLERGIKPERILLVTFNRDAKDDLNHRLTKERLGELSDDVPRDRPVAAALALRRT